MAGHFEHGALVFARLSAGLRCFITRVIDASTLLGNINHPCLLGDLFPARTENDDADISRLISLV